MTRAQEIYNDLCDFLEDGNYKYEKDDENLTLTTVREDPVFPIKITVKVESRAERVIMISPIPYIIPEEKRAEFATYVCYANNHSISGFFAFDISTGTLKYKMINFYKDSTLGKRLYRRMLTLTYGSAYIIGQRLIMVSEGDLELEDLYDY